MRRSTPQTLIRLLATLAVLAPAVAEAGGMFLPGRNLLAAFLEGQGRQQLRRTLQHEAFHQFAYNAISPDLPIWPCPRRHARPVCAAPAPSPGHVRFSSSKPASRTKISGTTSSTTGRSLRHVLARVWLEIDSAESISSQTRAKTCRRERPVVDEVVPEIFVREAGLLDENRTCPGDGAGAAQTGRACLRGHGQMGRSGLMAL